MKRILIIILILILVAGAAYLGWRNREAILDFAGGGAAEPPPPPPQTAPPISPLTSRAVSDYWVKRDTGEIYYAAKDGTLYKISPGGGETKVSDQSIPELQFLRGSEDGAYAIAAFGPARATSFSIFHTEDASWTPLPANTAAAAWDPVQERVLFIEEGVGASVLRIYNVLSKKTTEVIRLNQKDFGLDWTLPNEVYLTEKPSAVSPSSVWALDVAKKTLRAVIARELGLLVQWSPDGSYGLKFSNSVRENSLTFIDKTNQISGPTLVTPTLPTKCLVGDSDIYCAVPRNIPTGVLLPDDYLKKKFYSRDDILRWNIASGKVELLLDGSSAAIDGERLEMSGGKLLFLNRYDGRLYSLNIGS